MKWYGSLDNRVDEGHKWCDVQVGTGITEYNWSDRYPYEVVEVKDQKHFWVRRLDHRKKDGSVWYSNDWDLFQNDSFPTDYVVQRGKYYYKVWTYVDEDGKTKRHYARFNISIGKAEYYYDYEF